MTKTNESITHAGQTGHALLLNHTANSYHWGCYATSMALYNGLIAGGYAVTTFPVELTHSISLGACSIEDIASRIFLETFTSRHAILAQALRDADLVVINGEGTLHGNHPAPLNLLALAWLAKHRFGLPVHLVNHSCFPDSSTGIADPRVETFYESCTAACHRVVVREPLSAEVYRRFGREVTLGFDSLPLFADRYLQPSAPPESDLLVGSGVSLTANETRAFVNTLSRMSPPGARIRFLAGARRREPPEDFRFVEALWQARFDVEILRPQTIQEWLDAVRGAQLMVTGRFHHLVAAAYFGTPVVTLRSNTPKSEGVCQMLGFAPPLVCSEACFPTSLAEAIEMARTGNGDKSTPNQQRALVELASRNLPTCGRLTHSPGPEAILTQEADLRRPVRKHFRMDSFAIVRKKRKPVLRRFFARSPDAFTDGLKQRPDAIGGGDERLAAADQSLVSIALDLRGIYDDPGKASALELLLQSGTFGPLDRARARALIARLVSAHTTKHNLSAIAELSCYPRGKTVILVPGQAENDASIRFEMPYLDTLTHLSRVRKRCPDAYILFKPHPNMSAQSRGGLSDVRETLAFADAVTTEKPLAILLDHVDEVQTITSIIGFEALLRGRRVVCEGVPFYAGWGLTKDMAYENPALARRTRRLTLTELVAGTLIHYPLYTDPPDGNVITVEQALDLLEGFRRAPSSVHPLILALDVMREWRKDLVRQFGGIRSKA